MNQHFSVSLETIKHKLSPNKRSTTPSVIQNTNEQRARLVNISFSLPLSLQTAKIISFSRGTEVLHQCHFLNHLWY